MLTDMLGISADFKGCEILVAAALSGDKDLLNAETSAQCHKCGEYVAEEEGQWCKCGPDNAHLGLHWLTAHTAAAAEHPPREPTKADRYRAKRGTFTRLFGGGPGTAADQLGTDVETMQKLFNAFNVVAPAFTQWDNWMKSCYDKGTMVWRDYSTGTNFSQDIPGEKHMIYRTYSGRNIYVTNGAHAAGNGAIQGTARELLVDGLLKWQHTRWGKLPVLPVHDQIIAFVPSFEAEAATMTLAQCMATHVLSSPGLPVYIGVDTDKPFVNWPDSS